MYILDISFFLIYIPWVLFIGLIVLIQKRRLTEFIPIAIISIYTSIAICKCFFPMPVITSESLREQYAYYEVQDYLIPFSFLKQHFKLWLVQLVSNTPFGLLFGLLFRKRQRIWALLLFAVIFASGIQLLIVLINSISGLHYLSLSIDSALASVLGFFIGGGLIILVKCQMEREQADEQV